jgi:hypothetical protein
MSEHLFAHLAAAWVYDDGGRTAAGFKGEVDDCAVRAIAIATGTSYREVYGDLFDHIQEFARGAVALPNVSPAVFTHAHLVTACRRRSPGNISASAVGRGCRP